MWLNKALHEVFPERGDFRVLSKNLSNKACHNYSEDIARHTYHNLTGLAIVYSGWHGLNEVIKTSTIRDALHARELLGENRKGQLMPTEAGKEYCLVGWEKRRESFVPDTVWRQKILNVIGTIH